MWIFNKIIERKVVRRIEGIKKEIYFEYQSKIANLDLLNKQLNEQIVSFEEKHKKAEEFFNSIWATAYSKAIDAVWPVLEKNIPHLLEIAERKAYEKAQEEFDLQYKLKIQNITSKTQKNDSVPVVKILYKQEKIYDEYLKANRGRNIDLSQKYQAQLDLIKELLKE